MTMTWARVGPSNMYSREAESNADVTGSDICAEEGGRAGRNLGDKGCERGG